MRQIDLDYLIITAFLLSSLYVATTGIVIDLFGSPQFFFHRRRGYVSATLAGLHLAFNWRRVTAYPKLKFRRRVRSSFAQAPGPQAAAGLTRLSHCCFGHCRRFCAGLADPQATTGRITR